MATRHVLDPVERIEDAEQVDATRRRLLHEIAHHIVGVVGIAHGIGRTQQHLQQQIRHGLAQPCQALPGILARRKRIATSKVAPPQHSTENI